MSGFFLTITRFVRIQGAVFTTLKLIGPIAKEINFVPGRPLQPRVIFSSKARAFQSEASF